MKTVAIVQARMGSSRMPGKSLMPLAGQPVIWHVVTRLARARRIDEVVLATTTARDDDVLAAFVEELGVRVVRGDVDNVLQRFITAIRLTGADYVARVTGDCPLVDPDLADLLLDRLIASGAAYVLVDPHTPLIDEGLDPCAAWALERLAAEVGGHPVAVEHVTGYFKHDPDFAPIVGCAPPPARRFAGARVSVDTPADLKFLQTLYDRLDAAPGMIDVEQVVALLRAEPGLLEINRHVRQKASTARTRKVLVRCDGDGEIGMGHVVRCVAVGEALRDQFGVGVTFAVERGAPARAMIAARAFALARRRDGASEGDWLRAVVAANGHDGVLVDVRNDLSRAALDDLRADGVRVAVLDDGGERRLAADLVFYPPVPQLDGFDWPGFAGERHVGWDFIPLRRRFEAARRPRAHARGPRPRVLVMMGGADPWGAAAFAVRDLQRLDADFDITVIVGPAVAQDPALDDAARERRHAVEILRDVDDPAQTMADSDLAVVAFGMTAYEVAALGVPALYVCAGADHAASARALERAGVGVSLGLVDGLGPGAVAAPLRRLLDDKQARRRMARNARHLIDGAGASRIAAHIVACIARGQASGHG